MYEKYSQNAFVILMMLLSVYVFFLLYPFVKAILNDIFYVLLPFILGGAFAYIFHPFVDRLEEKRVSRATAVIIVFLLIAYVILFFGIMFVPMLLDQFETFGSSLPKISQNVEGYMGKLRTRLSFIEGSENITASKIGEEIVDNVYKILLNLVDNVFS